MSWRRQLWAFVCAVVRHWWLLMITAALTAISLIPAVSRTPAPKWFYWLGAVICLFFSFFLAWRDENNRAEAYKKETDEMYADMILDWLKQNNPMQFDIPFLADKIELDANKVLRGLATLERELHVVRNDGHLGWVYFPQVSMRFKCTLRKIVAT